MSITPEALAASGTEHGHQCALFAAFACSDMRTLYPELELCMFAIPNGGARGEKGSREAKLNGAMMKAEGVKKGVSDVFVAVPRHSKILLDNSKTTVLWFGLFLELKRLDGGAGESNEQKAFGAAVTEQGYAYVVCHGWQQAYATIRAYMDGLL